MAAKIGGRILASGGNAADAAVAAAFAQGVTNPLMCGLSGTAIALVSRPDGHVRVVNGECEIGSGTVPKSWIAKRAGRAEAIGRYVVGGDDNQIGPKSAMVPGFVAACRHLHERYGSGRVTWRGLIEPAIRLAVDGFLIYPYIAQGWGTRDSGEAQDRPGYPSLRTKLSRDPVAQRTYLKGGRRTYEAGDTLKQPVYGATLDQLALAGPADFYDGAIGRAMAEDLRRRGSLVRRADIARYRALEQRAINARYGRFEIRTTPPPSPGVQILEMLGVLERLGFGRMPFAEACTLDIFANTMRAGFLDNLDVKAVALADAGAFAARVLKPKRLDDWAARIRRGERIDGGNELASAGTTHVSVVDDEGMSVGLTHSIGSIAGSGAVTPELGFLHNNFLGHFDPRPGTAMSIVAGRRIGSGAPTLALEDGVLRLILGAPGGSRIITAILQVLVHALDHGMDPQSAVSQPRLHSEERQLVHLEPSWPARTRAELAALGNTVEWNAYQARVQAISIRQDGTCAPGADPRGGAVSKPSRVKKPRSLARQEP
ncbi:MAG: gamma-glutamyltransferase family protein [Tagaea sp.]|nr:gamma-glutamyltransferase family protein [Tagaea sp.]